MQTHDEYEPKSLFDLQRTCSVWQSGVAEAGDQGAYSVVSIKGHLNSELIYEVIDFPK